MQSGSFEVPIDHQHSFAAGCRLLLGQEACDVCEGHATAGATLVGVDGDDLTARPVGILGFTFPPASTFCSGKASATSTIFLPSTFSTYCLVDSIICNVY